MIRVIVIDDEEAIRQTLVRTISHQPDLEIVGEGIDGVQGVSLGSETGVDVIVMDINMPVMDGFEAVRTLRRKGIQTPVVFYSSEADASSKARRLPNSQFVFKDRAGAREVLASIRKAGSAAVA